MFCDTTHIKQKYRYNNYYAPFITLEPDIALSFATTESQKKAAKGLNFVVKNELELAADLFCEAMIEKDTMDLLWRYFPDSYYSQIAYD